MLRACKRAGILTLAVLLCLSMMPNMASITFAQPTSSEQAVLTDDLNDWTKTFSHTENLQFDTANSANFGSDTSRAQRKTQGLEEIVWKFESTNSVEAVGYHSDTLKVDHFGIYISEDGKEWTKTSPTIKQITNKWKGYTYTLTGLSNVNYVKVKWEAKGDKSWNPQLSKVTLKATPAVSVPQNVTAVPSEDMSQVVLNWEPSISIANLPVKYDIYRNAEKLTTIDKTSYTDQVTEADDEINYYIIAHDGSGKVSEASSTVQVIVRIPADRLPPAGWENTQWVDPGNWETIDVTKYGLPANNREIDASEKVHNIIEGTSGRRVLYFPEGVYYFKSTLTVKTGDIIFRGDGLEKTLLAIDGKGDQINAEIRFQGNNVEVVRSIVAGADGNYPVVGDTQITVADASSFESGDYIQLGNTIARDVNFKDKDELFFTVAAKEGNTLTLDKPIKIPYSVEIAPIAKELYKVVASESGSYPKSGDQQITVPDASHLKVGDCIQLGNYKGRIAYSQPTESQIFQITAIEGNTLTLDMKIGLDYPEDRAPAYKVMNMLENIGIEQLKVQRVNQPTVENTSSMVWVMVHNSYIRDTEWYMAGRGLIALENVKNIIVEDNYLHGAFVEKNSYAYGVFANYGATRVRITNNKLWDLRHQILFQLGVNHSVVSYNSAEPRYCNEGYNDIALHANYAYMNLFEGNKFSESNADNSKTDTMADTGPENTWFRNMSTDTKRGVGSVNGGTKRQNIIGNHAQKIASSGSDHFIAANMVGDTVQWGGINESAFIPNSLYLTSTPEFFNEKAWPLYGPGVDQWGAASTPPAFDREKPNSPVVEGDTSEPVYTLTDHFSNLDKVSSADRVTIVTDQAEQFAGDTERAVQVSTDGQAGEIVYNKLGITAFEATGYVKDEGASFKFFTSKSGKEWTEAEPTITTVNDGVWKEKLFALQLDGSQFVKVQWDPAANQVDIPQLGRVELQYRNKLVDDMNDWSYVDSVSENVTFDTTEPDKAEGDPSRAALVDVNGSGEIVWASKDMKSFEAVTYLQHGSKPREFKFYTSEDGVSYTQAAHQRVKIDLKDWKKVTYSLDHMQNVNYVKLEWPTLESNQDAATQVSKFTIKSQTPAAEAPDLTAPTGLAGTLNHNEIQLAWAPSESQYGGVVYSVYRSGMELGQVNGPLFMDTDIVPGHTYRYYVVAKDAKGNVSDSSNIVQIIVDYVDNTAPTVPQGVTGVVYGASIDLYWQPSTDDFRVTGYKITRNGAELVTVKTNSFKDTGLVIGETYTYTVAAIDASGQVSAPSEEIVLKAEEPKDAVPPTAPQGVTAHVYGNDIELNWSPSVDDSGIVE